MRIFVNFNLTITVDIVQYVNSHYLPYHLPLINQLCLVVEL